MRVLVTGGCGYIGSHQTVNLLEAGHDVTVVDDLSTSSHSVLDNVERVAGLRPRFVELNILDTGPLTETIVQYEPEAIIHFAGFKHVPESTERVLDYYENNVAGLLSLLRACQPTEMRRMVFSSSGSVYGETDRLPIVEDHPLRPTNPYSSSKAICERLLADLCDGDPSWSVAALRYFNPAGAHPSGLLGEDPLGPASNLLPALTRSALTETPQANIYGTDFATPDGSGVRDYIHVMDVALTHAKALRLIAGASGFTALNVGRGVGLSVSEVVEAVERASGREFDVQTHPRRPGDVSALYGDTTRAQMVLGPIDYRGLDEICEDAWRWEFKNDQERRR